MLIYYLSLFVGLGAGMSIQEDILDIPPIETISAVETNPIATVPGTIPVGTNPIGTNPIETNPIGTNPIGTNPIGTNPIGTNPIGTNPIGTNPIGTNPISNTPTGTKIILESFPALLVNVLVKSDIKISLNTAKLLRVVDIMGSFIYFLYNIYNIYETQLGNIIPYKPNEKLTQGLKYINNLLNPNIVKEKLLNNDNLLMSKKTNGMFICIYTYVFIIIYVYSYEYKFDNIQVKFRIFSQSYSRKNLPLPLSHPLLPLYPWGPNMTG
jgi:hypothetical protein